MGQILNILQQNHLSKYCVFDPNDKDHLAAYQSLREHGRQLPDMRFFLEEPFLDVVSMMQYKICRAFIERNEL